MLGMADLDQLLPRRMGQFSGKKQPLTGRELDSTVISIMMGRPSLCDTLPARMGSESSREIMFLKELMD